MRSAGGTKSLLAGVGGGLDKLFDGLFGRAVVPCRERIFGRLGGRAARAKQNAGHDRQDTVD